VALLGARPVMGRSGYRSSSGTTRTDRGVGSRSGSRLRRPAQGSSGLNSRPAPYPRHEGTCRHNYLVRRRPRQPRLVENGRRTGGSRAVAVRRDARSEATARVPRTSGAKGTGGPRLEAVARSCTDAEATRWPARSAAQPAERPARRRRSGVRPRWFSAGQRVFDCVFLKKVE
jgi:hypothetical protein